MSLARPIHLFLDFDTTLTKSDTLLPLSNIGYSHPHPTAPIPWSSIVSAYLTSLELHTSRYPHPPSSRTTLVQEAAWLASLYDVERGSFERAVNAGVWDGVTNEEMLAGAGAKVQKGEVSLRNGWEETAERVLRGGSGTPLEGKVSVVSVNWSRTWIWGCLQASIESHVGERSAAGAEKHREKIAAAIKNVRVYANELPNIEGENLRGQSAFQLARTVSTKAEATDEFPEGQARRLHTADDKLRCLRSLLNDHTTSIWTEDEQRSRKRADFINQGDARPLSVYVGDSISDLLCLLEADVGICIRDDPMGSGMKELTEVCTRLKVNVSWIGDFDWDHHSGGPNKPTEQDWAVDWKRDLWWARDFVEIEKWLQRPS